MEDRDGQHIGVVTKALVKLVPPSSIILRVLFITCKEPSSTSWSSVIMRMMLGRMFLRSLWMRPLSPWDLVVVKAKPPGDQSRDSSANQASHCISMVPETADRMGRAEDYCRVGGRELRSSQATHSLTLVQLPSPRLTERQESQVLAE